MTEDPDGPWAKTFAHYPRDHRLVDDQSAIVLDGAR
jgi:hypothetical protein